MGWRGAGENSAASEQVSKTTSPIEAPIDPKTRGVYVFFGGLLMIGGGFLVPARQYIPFVVFMSFGAFWLSFAAILCLLTCSMLALNARLYYYYMRIFYAYRAIQGVVVLQS